MKITRARLLGAVATAAIAAVSLTGCSGQSSSSDSSKGVPTLPANKKVTITFEETMASGTLKPALQNLVDEFQQKNPNITVNLESQPGYPQLKQKVDSMVSAGNPPTIAQVYPEWAASYLEADALQPLDDYAKGNSELSDFYAGVKNSLYVNKKLATWPFNASNMVMYYNPDLLKNSGASVPKTWDEFAETTKKVSHDGVTGIAVDPGSSSGPANGTQLFQVMAADNGTSIFSSDGTPHFNDKGAVDALQTLVDLKKAGALQTGSNYPGQAALGSQKGAFDVSTTTSYFYNKQAVGNKFAMGVAKLPSGKNGKATNLLSGTSIAMFSKASDDQKAAAWKFMQFLAQPSTQAEWSSKTGYLPVTKKALSEKVMKDYIAQNPYVEVAAKDLENSKALPPQSWVQEADGMLAVAIGDALNGSSSPKDALDKAQKQAKALVSK